MNSFWLYFTDWVATIPWIWVVMVVAVLSVLHPIIENPAGILMLTFLATYWHSPYLAALYLWGWNLVGLQLMYDLLHRVQPWGSKWIKKHVPQAPRFFYWLKNQPEWKHILVIALPLVYTYPLRIAWTVWQPSRVRYSLQSSFLYALFHLANIGLFLGLREVLENRLPLWVFAGILTLLAILMYRVKPNIISNPSIVE